MKKKESETNIKPLVFIQTAKDTKSNQRHSQHEQRALESTFICSWSERYEWWHSQQSEKIAFSPPVDMKRINILWQFNLVNNYGFSFASLE